MSGLRELLAHLGGIALFAVPGFALAGLFPGLRATPWLRRLGYGHLLGIAAVAGTLYALSALLGVPLRRPAIFGTAAVLTAAGTAGWFRARRRPVLRLLPLRARMAALFLALAGAVVSAGLFADALVFPLRDWDGRMHWTAQARYIRFEGSVLPLAVVRGQWYINHPRYPVLLPVAQTAVLEATGAGEDELFFRGLYASFFPAFLLVLYDGARRWAGWLPAGLAAAAAAGIPFLTFFVDGGAAGSYSDLPLACFYGAALVLLLRSRVFPSDGIAAGLLLGAAVLTKNEGTILAVFALLAAALVPAIRLWRERKGSRLPAAVRRRLLLKGARACAAASVLLAVLAFFFYWRFQIPNRQDENYEEFVTAEHLFPDALTRIPDFGSRVLVQTFLTWDRWLGFWWVAVLVLLVGWGVLKGRRSALSWPLLLGFAAPLAIAWGAYTVSVHWDPADLARVTWERFLVQGSLPFFLLFSLALREVLQRSALGWRGYSNRSRV